MGIYLHNKKVLAFAREAGGANAIAPVCQAILKEGWDLLLLSKDYGLDVFKKKGFICVEFPVFDGNSLDKITRERFNSLPDIIFTSATSLPTLDMTEKYLWKWGKERKITTVGVLDQWQNYALRFSGPGEDQRLGYVPDHIFAIDELSKEEMIREGIPEENIFVTGQPAFDQILEEYTELSLQGCLHRDRLNLEKDLVIVTFVAESLKKDFGNSLGYNEQSTLRFLGDTLEEFCRKSPKKKLCLLIKLHPENKDEEFQWVKSQWPLLKKVIIEKEFSSREVIELSDIVVGMTSIMLVEAIIANKITVSFQINSLLDSQLAATKAGAIPFIKTRTEGRQVLSQLLLNEMYRQKYLYQQQQWNVCRNGVTRCMEILRSL